MKNLITNIKVVEDGIIPSKTHEHDACYDMYARKITRLRDGLYEIMLGVCIQPPVGYRVAIYPRSSISKTGYVLANSVGVGDNNYTGEYRAYFTGVPIDVSSTSGIISSKVRTTMYFDEFPYEVGDRVCQMELVEYNQIQFIEVDNLKETKRGEGGFGSTNKK